jgi:hypothetical protein
MNFEIIKGAATSALGKTTVVVKKYSPEILLGVGITGAVVSTVMACKATLKVDAIKQEMQANFVKITEAKATYDPEVYSEQDYKKDMTVTYVQGAVALGKLYAPAVTLGAASVAMILASHGIMSKRQAALFAAYKVLDTSYDNYRRRVIATLGETEDEYFRFGYPERPREILNEEGELVEEVDDMPLCMRVGDTSGYARWFDENQTQFRRDRNTNEHFLRVSQMHANDMLRARGHVFLNEVYDMLGMPRSKEGAVVGWVAGHGDDSISYGLDSHINQASADYLHRDGRQHAFLLDFNVDGVIFDMI